MTTTPWRVGYRLTARNKAPSLGVDVSPEAYSQVCLLLGTFAAVDFSLSLLPPLLVSPRTRLVFAKHCWLSARTLHSRTHVFTSEHLSSAPLRSHPPPSFSRLLFIDASIQASHVCLPTSKCQPPEVKGLRCLLQRRWGYLTVGPPSSSLWEERGCGLFFSAASRVMIRACDRWTRVSS